jgi:putative pyruvate formate lyase activating enzyme
MTKQKADRFVVPAAAPTYLAESVQRNLSERVAAAQKELTSCCACPRQCRVDRLGGQTGFCQTGRYAQVSSAGAHLGEEDCLRGSRGSGTIFFAHCNLRCVFCQNWDISQGGDGREMDAAGIAELMLGLQERGCHNINLVTPEHVVPQVVEALVVAIEHGLRLPVVYNTSAYDAPSSLSLMDGLVDIYMPDFKLWSTTQSDRLLGAKDYGERACEALREMHRQVGDLTMTPEGLACRGVMVRHLVMPGLLDESRRIFRFLAGLSRDTYVNIMAQYHPAHKVGTAAESSEDAGSLRHTDINRTPSSTEMDAAYEAARRAGLWRFDARNL